jgi:DNA-binding MarR family transcriptional regulator
MRATLESSKVIERECFCLALKRAARTVARRYDEGFSHLDLSSGQFSTLTVIAGLQPVGMVALGERLGMDRTTVTAALKPLQRRGLVSVEVSKSDPRGRDATITKRGASLLEKAIPIWEELQLQIANDVELSDVARLREDLVALR